MARLPVATGREKIRPGKFELEVAALERQLGLARLDRLWAWVQDSH